MNCPEQKIFDELATANKFGFVPSALGNRNSTWHKLTKHTNDAFARCLAFVFWLDRRTLTPKKNFSNPTYYFETYKIITNYAIEKSSHAKIWKWK